MYLKRIEMQGFKSFADKTVLEFKPGITTVIGPNGSGKSNISDAIRWVLGEQSMKSLRGAKSEDIIFAGTQARKSLGFAEVSIVIDNNDNKLPIEYSEVTVTRKIYRSGETGYFINKVPCRLKDILELFMDTGIGKDGYSIIGQGKIDEILSNKSEDRRHIFEEAAGIVKYRTRKQESEKKLEQTKLNLLRINDILAEIEANIEPLKLQSDKAKQFLDLREELKSIEVGLFIYNINTYKEKLEQLVKDEDIITSQKEAEDGKMEALQASKEELRQVVDDITAQIENMQNIGFESSNKIEKINSEIGISNERIQNNTANKQRLEAEILEVKSRIEELKEEQRQKLEKKTNLTSNKEKFEKELAEKEAELAELSKKLSAKELEIEGKKQIVQDNIDKKYELAAEINTQDVNYENLEKRKKQLKNEIDSVISELDSTRYGKNEISKGFYDIESKRNIAVENLEKSVQAKEQNMQKLKQYEDEISKLTYTQRMKQARHQFLIETEKEKEGYNKTVKSLLVACDKDSSLNKGIHGVLANLISVEKEYETAQNAEQIISSLNMCVQLLSGEESASDLILKAESELEDLSDSSPYSELYERLSAAEIEISDIADELTAITDKIELDGQRVEYLRQRISKINHLKRKYMCDCSQLIDMYNNALEETGSLESSSDEIKKLNEEKEELLKVVTERAKTLSKFREETARKFVSRVTEELTFLNMTNVILDVKHEKGKLTVNGMDTMEFLISANKGEEPKPISRIASGGELSRIMLALKSVIADKDSIPTMIFDEIDTGVSGKAAQKIGIKLKSIGKVRQVICVTHLSQIAVMADNHLMIEKKTDNERTETSVYQLDFKGRTAEIARIMGGENPSQLMLKTAEEELIKAKEMCVI